MIDPRERDWTSAGFTLLEVMVSVAILGLALTAIFSSEVGAMKIGNRAVRTNMATPLARCKMGEIEEFLANRGLPALDDRGTDGCCRDAEIVGYSCEWSIDRIILPEIGMGGVEHRDGVDDAPDPNELMSGRGSIDGITQMAVTMAYPALKPVLEEQVRRVNVAVRWREGNRDMSFDVVQYVIGEVGEAPPEDVEGIVE